jgi:molybdopterin biosynthesis enzyme MoaB
MTHPSVQTAVAFEDILELSDQEVPGVAEAVQESPVHGQHDALVSRATTFEPVAKLSSTASVGAWA